MTNLIPPNLKAAGVSKRFGSLAALDDVSLELAPGCFHALLGENGAGKSTLAKCIMGDYIADKGTIWINNEEQKIDNPRAAHALGIGMVYQHFSLVPNMTVAENLVVVRPGYGDLLWPNRLRNKDRRSGNNRDRPAHGRYT